MTFRELLYPGPTGGGIPPEDPLLLEKAKQFADRIKQALQTLKESGQAEMELDASDLSFLIQIAISNPTILEKYELKLPKSKEVPFDWKLEGKHESPQIDQDEKGAYARITVINPSVKISIGKIKKEAKADKIILTLRNAETAAAGNNQFASLSLEPAIVEPPNQERPKIPVAENILSAFGIRLPTKLNDTIDATIGGQFVMKQIFDGMKALCKENGDIGLKGLEMKITPERAIHTTLDRDKEVPFSPSPLIVKFQDLLQQPAAQALRNLIK